MLVIAFTTIVPAAAAPPAPQIPFEQATRELASSDPGVRLRAVRLLKDSAYPEAALPLAPLVTDPDDAVQFEAIAAELNIFLAQKIVTRRRVALVIEVRNRIAAEAAFSAGPFALGTNPVPLEVLTALRSASRDENPRVGVEALYAFGVLCVDAGGTTRRELLRGSGAEIATMVGAPDAVLRLAAVRVLGRLFARRAEDDPIDERAGDAVIAALNDSDRTIRAAGMDALGAMQYARAVTGLTELFEYYGRGALAEAALGALARIGHAASVPLFAAQLAGGSVALKLTAIEGLGRAGDRAREPDIQATLVRERNRSLHLAGSFASVLLSNGQIDPIAEALTQPGLRDQALMYLIELAPGRVAAFRRHAQDPDARLRADVADVLALSGDQAALAIVEPLMRDRDPEVAHAAERAVARLQAARRRASS